jgi:hypothetical protein
MLENKLNVLTSLNISCDSDDDSKTSFNLFGTNKSIVVDKAKLREAITIQDCQVVEKMAAPGGEKLDLPNIASAGLSENDFLEQAIKVIG